MSRHRLAAFLAVALVAAVPASAQPAGGADQGPAQSESAPAVAAPDASISSEPGQRPVWRGYFGLEGRPFTESPAISSQARNGLSLVAQPEFSYQSHDHRQRIDATLFGRFSVEPRHGSVDVRELNWQYHGERWSLLAGMNRVFWGATESRHAIDIVNQSDLRENFVGDVKLGQLMVAATLQRRWGQLELYVLPAFRMRAFASSDDRPRIQLPLADAEVASGRFPDWAARASVSRGDVDLHVYYFRGVSREPELIPVFGASGAPIALKPFYQDIGQVAADVQVARGAWLFKGELMNRTKPGATYQAGVGGVEYGITRLFGSVSDMSLLAEYQFDNRPASEWPAPATRGVYSGLRFALNDKASSELKAGTVYDLSSRSWLLRAEFTRRLNNQWGVYVGCYGFGHVAASPALRDFDRDSHFTITLRRYL